MKKIVCLMGPTAAGKTQIALALAQCLPIEIISVDSALVYRKMDIGTAKPSSDEQALVPHHLIDILNPDQSFSVAEFCKRALDLISSITAQGRIPLLVGGTMMYFRALQQGLAELPETNDALREQLNQKALIHGWDKMHQLLKQFDPVTADRLHPNDTQRIQRALEVYYISGRPLSSFAQLPHKASSMTWNNILLMPKNRAWLHQRIESRFNLMLRQGFIDEVQTLLNQWQLSAEHCSMRTVGYRQALGFLNGDMAFEPFKQKALAATRQLAKRQLTWLRHWPDGVSIDCENFDELKRIKNIIQQSI